MFDLAVIGAGPGGYVAAVRAAQLGMRTICIDKENSLGGTCLNVGCIPSKCLLYSSEQYDWLKHKAAEHGIHFEDPHLDFSKMMQRKNSVVKGLTEGIVSLFKQHGIERVVGEAFFKTTHSLQIGERIIEAKAILLATGSEPTPLPHLPFDEKRILSSTGALALPEVPKKLLVVGAGVIGVELASVYQRLGCAVTLVEMLEVICPSTDLALSKMLLTILKKQGLTFHLGAKVTQVIPHEKEIELKMFAQGKEQSLTADHLLVAVGRRPYTTGLKLEEGGVKKNERGFVQVDQNFRTSQPHIYAIGDLIEGPMLAHRASEEGVAAVEALAGLKPRINYMTIPNVIYTYPEAASVGLTEQEARALKLEPLIGISHLRGNPRARCLGDYEGMVKVIGEKQNGRLIGLHILAPYASEMIGEGVVALEKRISVAELAATSHAHPALSEAIKEAAGSALGHAIHQ